MTSREQSGRPVTSQIVILAGGLGTRLRPITEKIPKPLVDVAGFPFLHWQLEECKRQGYRRILLLVSYLGEQIEAHFGDGRRMGLEISYSFEKEPLGTGGAIKNALAKLDREFFVLNGDSFLRAPLREMADFFVRMKVPAVVSTYSGKNTPVIPNLKVQAEHVTEYLKNGGAGFQLIDSGVYVLSRALFEGEARTKFLLEDLWPGLIARRGLACFAVGERFYDIGTPERLKEFEEKIHDYFANPISR